MTHPDRLTRPVVAFVPPIPGQTLSSDHIISWKSGRDGGTVWLLRADMAWHLDADGVANLHNVKWCVAPAAEPERETSPQAEPADMRRDDDFGDVPEPARVKLVGHACAAEPAAEIHASLRIEDEPLQIAAHAAEAARAIRLNAVSFDGVAIPAAAATLVLEGLGNEDGGALRLQLPPCLPRLWIDSAGDHQTLDMHCASLWIDVDRRELSVLWEAYAAAPAVEQIERVVVILDPPDEARGEHVVLGELQRATYRYARNREDYLPEAESLPDDDDRLRAARYRSWGAGSPEPRVSLEEYATTSAALAEKTTPEGRRPILEDRGYDEDRWFVEERAWLERFARQSLDGDVTLAMRYGELFLAAQQALETDEERARSLDEAFAVECAIDDGADAQTVFAEHALTLPQWLRLERRYHAALEADPALAAEYAARRAAMPPPAPASDDGEEPPP